MKFNLFFSVVILVAIAAGCTKDPVNETATGQFKSSEVKTVPLHADIYAIVTQEESGVAFLGNLAGNMSHLGQLITENSTFERTYFEFREGPAIYWEMIGDVAAANGDLLHYTLWGLYNITLNQYASTVTYSGGTGRFENASGFLDITGYVDQQTGYLMMDGEGSLTTVGSNN